MERLRALAGGWICTANLILSCHRPQGSMWRCSVPAQPVNSYPDGLSERMIGSEKNQKPTKIHFDPNQLETTSLSFLNLKKQIQTCRNHFDRKLRSKLYRGRSMVYNSGSTSRKSEKALRSVITKLCGVKNQFCLPNYASDSAKVSLIRDFQAVLQRFSNLVRSEVRFGCEDGSRRHRRSGKSPKTLGNPPNQKVSETKKAILAQFYYSVQIGFKPLIIRDRDLPKL